MKKLYQKDFYNMSYRTTIAIHYNHGDNCCVVKMSDEDGWSEARIEDGKDMLDIARTLAHAEFLQRMQKGNENK